MNTTRMIRRAPFSTKTPKAELTAGALESWKSIHPITKLAHVKLDLGRVLSENNLPLVRQNVKNRKAEAYADPDRVAMLYNRFRTLRYE